MSDYERPIVIDWGFDSVVSEAARALHDEGLEIIARIDVRDQFRIALRHDFRRYTLIEAWSPALALEALQHDLAVGTSLPATFAIYELADGETAVVATDRLSDRLSAACSARAWRRHAPSLASIGDDQGERITRVLARLRHAAARRSCRPLEPSPQGTPLSP